MRVLIDGNIKLHIPDTMTAGDQIVAKTPQHKFLKSHWSDIQKEMGALKALLKYSQGKWRAETIVDLMAGCGFSGKIFQKYKNPEFMVLNDLSIESVKILADNFSQSLNTVILCKDAKTFSYEPNHYDLLFVDFNSFTINHFDQWHTLFSRASKNSNHMIVTDTACFGFRFGNLKSYGVETPLNYYNKTREEFLARYDKRLHVVCGFGNAALLWLVPKRSRISNEIVFIEPENVSMVEVKDGTLW